MTPYLRRCRGQTQPSSLPREDFAGSSSASPRKAARGVYPHSRKRGARGTPRTCRSSTVHVRERRSTWSCLPRVPVCPDVPHAMFSRLAPHEPRWTNQAFLLGEAPLSTAGGSLTPDAPYLGYARPRPGDPICGTRRLRAGHRAAWAAGTRVRRAFRPSPPCPAFKNASGRRPSVEQG